MVALLLNALIANLSFCIGLVDAVREYNLNNADFAGADLTIEILFLAEAKSAAMDQSLRFNDKLADACDQAEHRANTDALTGLANRRAMTQVLTNKVMHNQDFACMHLDLDYFKLVNDTDGHAAGDHILVEVARILKSETRKGDCVARVGGEFILLFDHLTDKNTLDAITRRIIEKLEVPVAYEGNICRISGSAGTSLSTDYLQVEADVLLSDANVALYAFISRGCGQHHFYSPDLLKLAS